MAGGSRRPYQFRRAAEIAPRAGLCDYRFRSAASNRRAGIERLANVARDGGGLTCQGRLVRLDRTFLDRTVGRDQISRREAHPVTGHEVSRCDPTPASAAQYPRLHMETATQQIECRMRAPFLHAADKGAEDEPPADDRRFDGFAQSDFKKKSRFKKPGDRPPQPPEKRMERARWRLDDFVRPKRDKTFLCRCFGQPARRANRRNRSRRTAHRVTPANVRATPGFSDTKVISFLSKPWCIPSRC
ncbi:hypothetical protein B932_1801 [Gluconobacter oxydans H24]|nr:hypothetical protein B932_1801 [Gluconobacter oxydans H24]